MSITDKLFDKTGEAYTPEMFWKWFTDNRQRFDQVIESNAADAPERLNEIVDELKKYDPWFKGLIGRYDETTSELIITADGDIALFLKVEQFIASAPELKDWRFTAHKPPLGFDGISIEMYGKKFDETTVHFYPVTDEGYPDLVSVVFTHNAYNEAEDEDFQTAGGIYVQNALGELNTATQLDHYEIGPEPEDKSALIPVVKLNDYVTWREKEFVEKYDSAAIGFPEELFNVIEGQDSEGNLMRAMVMAGYEDWEYKPVFCWWVRIEMEYEGAGNGLPDKTTLQILHDIEEKAVDLLTIGPNIIYTGSKTFKGCRTVYFYAKDYREPSRLLYSFCESQENNIKLGFFIEKDKYWQNMEEFYGLEDEDFEEDEIDPNAN
jgi:hypothetical protein